MRSASNLWEWLTSNFSKQYHCWMKHKRHENQGNDHRLVKLVILNKVELAFFFPHVSRAERLAPARTRTRVVRLEAQRTDPWTTEQSRGVDVPAVQLTTRVKSSTLYGRTSKFFPRDGLLRYCINMGYALRAPLLIQYEPDEWWE